MDNNEEQQVIDELFPIFQKYIADIRKGMSKMKDFGKERKLLNAGILLNNKVVELGNKFKDKGIGFYSESSLKSVILSKLSEYYQEAYEQIKLAVQIDVDTSQGSKFLDYEAVDKYRKEYQETMDIYDELCKKIYSYEIEKNIVEDIVERFDVYNDREVALEKLEKWKNELTVLGYGYLIEEIDAKISEKTKKDTGDEENPFPDSER